MSLSSAKCRIIPAFGLLLSFLGMAPVLAGYTPVLKEGRVIDAQARPNLREGYHQFASIDHEFHSLQASLIDEATTPTANDSAKTPRKGKVFTNDDLDSKSPETAPANSPETNKPETKTGDTAKSEKSTEDYWRGEFRKLRDRIAPLDLAIEKLKKEIKTFGNGGFDLSTGLQQNTMYIVDRDARLKRLEKQRDGLQEQLDILVERGRKAGAPPGWFR